MGTKALMKRSASQAVDLTPDEARLLSLFAELSSGFIPYEFFEDLAERSSDVEDVGEVLEGLQRKGVLNCDAFNDGFRAQFGLLPQGDKAEALTFSVGPDYRKAKAKYLPPREG